MSPDASQDTSERISAMPTKAQAAADSAAGAKTDAPLSRRQQRKLAQPPRRRGLLVGLILIVIGGAWLLNTMIPWFRFHLMWPVLLIVIGLYLLLRRRP
jgi:fatty acid desaturase